ncbi:hypothetical protein IV77_GL000352 [Olsenella uli DSM 7084]|nr:hypothetical protein HMPREF1503_1054 [Olsenella uli MSTE5]KRO12907.1 hypothetical protein IV77_GL000352 [Olsenella uli DSM 7084]
MARWNACPHSSSVGMRLSGLRTSVPPAGAIDPCDRPVGDQKRQRNNVSRRLG